MLPSGRVVAINEQWFVSLKLLNKASLNSKYARREEVTEQKTWIKMYKDQSSKDEICLKPGHSGVCL